MSTGALDVLGPGVLPPIGAPTEPAEVAALVAEAATRGVRLRLVGRGTWLDAGAPVAADAVLPLGGVTGVVEYVPGDLTLTALAGTSLAELTRLTAAEGQMLALDPFGDAAGTLGATVATGSTGPLAHAFGPPRDQVIGLAFIDGAGRLVRAGGRVVKNVAGFDLVRLLTGAWGTLGALVEVSVRLRPRPEVERTVVVAAPGGARFAAWLQALPGAVLALPPALWALELVNGALAERLGVHDRPVLLARLAGNAGLVEAGARALAALGDPAPASADVWHRLQACEPRTAIVARRSVRPSRLGVIAAEPFSRAADAVGLLAHATPSRGIVRLVLPGERGFGLPRWDAPPSDGGPPPVTVVERAPPALRPVHAAWLGLPRAHEPLARRVRAAFDPAGILNPGILGPDTVGPGTVGPAA